jgi:hypothetical protein
VRPAVSSFRRRPTGRFEALAGLSALLYLGWSLVPAWYRSRGGPVAGATLPPASLNGWGGPTAMAAVVAAIATSWVGLRTGREVRRRTRLVMVDTVLAAAGLSLTLAGFVLGRPGAFGAARPSWGLFVGLGLSAVWAFGAVWALRHARAFDLPHP